MTAAVRLATSDDIAALEALIARSVRGLMGEWLDPAQMEAALGTVLGVDEGLIADGTYFVAEEGGAMLAAGGWSKRATLFGVPQGRARLLDPLTEAARIRAFFVDPAAAGRGLGTLLLEHSERAAREAGFEVLELMATPTGIAFYERRGFETVVAAPIEIPGGSSMPGRVMRKRL